VSVNLLRIVPSLPDWVPSDANAGAAAEAVRRMCPYAEELISCRYPEVTFIDQGGNFELVRCPECDTALDTGWWQQQMDRAYAAGFGGLATVTPCCAVAVSLNDLNYIWPAGFARFEIQVRSPGRGWLSPEEMNQVSAELGIAVRQIMSYY